MKKKPKYLRPRRKSSKVIWVLCGVLVLLLSLVFCIKFWVSRPSSEPSVEGTSATTGFVPTTNITVETTEIFESTAVTEETVPLETTQPQILSSMAELYAENPDTVGWIRIGDTKLDYPVMYTPNDPEKYLHLDFKENYSFGGLPFIDANCSLDPESDNLIIYGHNMQNGTMFRTLMSYDTSTFWKANPIISFSTLYEEREYEIIAAFYDRVYYTYEDCFKFYNFIDAEDEAHFNEAMTYYKEHSLYDTGVTAEYGDNLITLVTCAYHVDNGRFVVVAKETRNG